MSTDFKKSFPATSFFFFRFTREKNVTSGYGSFTGSEWGGKTHLVRLTFFAANSAESELWGRLNKRLWLTKTACCKTSWTYVSSTTVYTVHKVISLDSGQAAVSFRIFCLTLLKCLWLQDGVRFSSYTDVLLKHLQFAFLSYSNQNLKTKDLQTNWKRTGWTNKPNSLKGGGDQFYTSNSVNMSWRSSLIDNQSHFESWEVEFP